MGSVIGANRLCDAHATPMRTEPAGPKPKLPRAAGRPEEARAFPSPGAHDTMPPRFDRLEHLCYHMHCSLRSRLSMEGEGEDERQPIRQEDRVQQRPLSQSVIPFPAAPMPAIEPQKKFAAGKQLPGRFFPPKNARSTSPGCLAARQTSEVSQTSEVFALRYGSDFSTSKTSPEGRTAPVAVVGRVAAQGVAGTTGPAGPCF
jgi:hypothetical protein